MTDAALETTLQLARPAGSTIAAVSDFDADGLADLLWVGRPRATGVTVGFTPSTSLHDGETASVVELGPLGEGERVLGAGDFDADGHADVLVASAAAVRAWLVGPDAAHGVSELGTPGGASFVGVGDFDASGTDDVAWRTPDRRARALADGRGAGALERRGGAGTRSRRDRERRFRRRRRGRAHAARRAGRRVPAPAARRCRPRSTRPISRARRTWRPVGSADLDRDGTDELVLAGAQAIRIAGMPGDDLLALDPDSDWQLVALIP